MSEGNKEKLPEAVVLGKRGGQKTLELHGKQQFTKMAKAGHPTTKRRYGRDFYRLMRAGYPVASMAPKERDQAIAKLDAK